jgi:hypothetical protein
MAAARRGRVCQPPCKTSKSKSTATTPSASRPPRHGGELTSTSTSKATPPAPFGGTPPEEGAKSTSKSKPTSAHRTPQKPLPEGWRSPAGVRRLVLILLCRKAAGGVLLTFIPPSAFRLPPSILRWSRARPNGGSFTAVPAGGVRCRFPRALRFEQDTGVSRFYRDMSKSTATTPSASRHPAAAGN